MLAIMTNMHIIKYVRSLDPLGLRTLAAAARVSQRTLDKIRTGETQEPGALLLDKLRPFVPERKK